MIGRTFAVTDGQAVPDGHAAAAPALPDFNAGRALPGSVAARSLPREGPAPGWIAVAYADWRVAEGPAPAEVLAAARSLECAGVLIDTFSKRSGSLFDWCRGDELRALAALARRQNLLFALAGRLSLAVNAIEGAGGTVLNVQPVRQSLEEAFFREISPEESKAWLPVD